MELHPVGPARCGHRSGRDAACPDHARLLHVVRARQRLLPHAAVVQRRHDVVGPRGFDPALGAHPHRVHGARSPEVPAALVRPAGRCGADRDARGLCLLLPADARAGQPLHDGGSAPGLRRPWAEPAPPRAHPDGDPSADALPRVRRLHGSLRLRHRRPRHRTPRRRLVGGDSTGHAHGLGLPHHRHPPGGLVELRGARLGRLLGLGPRGERVAVAVDHRHRLLALGDGAGTSRDAARLEPVTAVCHLQPHDPRHVSHALRGARVGSRLQRRRHRRVAPQLLCSHRRGHTRVDRVARRQAAFAGPDRLAPVSRGRVPRQQRVVRGLRVRRAARHCVPTDRRGTPGTRCGRGPAVLQSDDRADRHRLAVHDGGGPGSALAQGLWGGAVAAAALARLVGRDRRCGHRRARSTRPGHGPHVRLGRLRRWGRVASGRAGHETPRLAGVRRPHERRDDRAPRRGDHRRRHRHQRALHPRDRDHPRTRPDDRGWRPHDHLSAHRRGGGAQPHGHEGERPSRRRPHLPARPLAIRRVRVAHRHAIGEDGAEGRRVPHRHPAA